MGLWPTRKWRSWLYNILQAGKNNGLGLQWNLVHRHPMSDPWAGQPSLILWIICSDKFERLAKATQLSISKSLLGSCSFLSKHPCHGHNVVLAKAAGSSDQNSSSLLFIFRYMSLHQWNLLHKKNKNKFRCRILSITQFLEKQCQHLPNTFLRNKGVT